MIWLYGVDSIIYIVGDILANVLALVAVPRRNNGEDSLIIIKIFAETHNFGNLAVSLYS